MRFTAVATLALTLLSPSVGGQTQVYRVVQPDGTVEYTDQPPDGASESHELPPLSTYSPPAPSRGGAIGAQRGDDDDDQPAANVYEEAAIVSPREDAAVRANDGNVNVLLRLSPGLVAGHRVRLLLDGAEASSGSATSFLLTNVDRGTHTLSAEVVDAAGQQVTTAPPVRFHVLRASRLLPGAGGN